MKFAVTPELATLLKTLRAQSGVSAKDLAAHLGHSSSYVSKLESGSLKSIQEETLTDVLTYISGGGDFYGEVLPNVYRALKALVDPQHLVTQAWFMQYDATERTVAVTDGLVDDIRRHIEKLGISSDELADFINGNYDSGLSDSYPANQIVILEYNGEPRLTYRSQISKEKLRRFLEKKAEVCPYMFLNNLLFVLFRMDYFPDEVGKLPPEEATVVLRCVADYMDQRGIHSLTRFSHMLSSEDFIEHQKLLIDDQSDIASRIAAVLKELAAADPMTTIGRLNAFYDTLNWDPAFAVKLMSIPFADLGSMSHRNKARLLKDVQNLVDSYGQLPEIQKKIEQY